MNDPSPLEAIFFAALGKGSPGACAAYLDEACAGDPDLRRRVEKMLAAQAQAGSFLEQPAPNLVMTVDEQPAGEGAGTLIGPYKLLEQIGEGGFGIVFMAEQQRPVRRKVALKVLKPGMDTRQVVARFEAERQALALMDHPHIAQVFDGGETPAGRPYFVMELVRGVPITDFCDQKQLSVRGRLGLFVDVCQAVQHAHQKGVIHRDLKPGNVLVTLHDDRAVVKVIDFGIAKAMSQQLTEKTVFTNFAQMIGTPLYMSPEQAQMSGLDVDTRSDVYSLGVLLYELLTGTTPFDKGRLREAGYDEMRRIIREEEPPRPSTRLSTLGQAAATVSARRRSDSQKLCRLIRGELDWIVMKCLEKDRNQRYDSASALAADVQRYLHDEPVLACPPTLRYRLGKLLRKHRGTAAAVAAVWLVLVCGIAATAAAYFQADAAKRAESEQRRAAEQARDEARQAEAEARATADFLTFDMMALAPAGEPDDKRTAIHDAIDAAVPEVDRLLGRQPRVEAAVRHVIGSAYRFLGEYDKARPQLERAVALRRRELGEDHPSTLSSQHNLCTVLHVQGRLGEAEALARHVLDARRRQLPPGHRDIASSLALLGLILTDRGQPERAEPLLREALDTFAAAFPNDHWRVANVRSLLGGCLVRQGRYAEAEPLLLSAGRALQAPRSAPRHHARRAVENLVRLYEAWGKNDKADEWRKELQRFDVGDKPRSRSTP
jgi:serine/threonine protein kinase